MNNQGPDPKKETNPNEPTFPREFEQDKEIPREDYGDRPELDQPNETREIGNPEVGDDPYGETEQMPESPQMGGDTGSGGGSVNG